MANDDQNKTKELEEQLADHKELVRRKREGIELDEKLLDLEKRLGQEVRVRLDLEEKRLEAQVKSNQLTQKQADLQLEIAKIRKNIEDLEKQGSEIDAERLAGLQKTLELTKDLSSAINDAATQGGLLADKIAPISNSFSRAAVASFELADGTNGISEAFKAYALNAAKGLTLSRALFSGLEKIVADNINTMKALDEIEASFVRATGLSREFATEAFELRFALSAVGISGQQAAESSQNLIENMSEFSQLSKAGRRDFGELAAMIDHLGGNAAGMGQTFTKVAGMSISQTSATMTRLFGVAESLEIPFSQISDDVQAMGPLFAKFGEEGVEVFEGLQAASKATGLSVRELYGVVSKFDAFDSAAQAAGRLHAALGVNIDSYTLLSASEEERILILQDLMAASGRTFEELSHQEVIELSHALGASLEETAQIFGTTGEEVRKTTQQLLYAGMTTEELEERVKAGQTAMEKLGLVMQNIALAAEPLVNIIQFLANVVLGFTKVLQSVFGDKAGGIISGVILLAAGLGSLVFVGKLVMGTFGGVAAAATGAATAMTGAATAMTSAATAISSAAPALGAAGPAAAPAIPPLLAFGAAVALIGIGIGAAAFGMSFLVKSFKDMDPGKIAVISIAIIAFAAAIVKLGSAAAAAAIPLGIAAGPLMAFGATMLMIGAGIGVAAAGMGYFVSQLKEMSADKIGATAAAILSLSAAIGVLALSIAALGALGPVAFVGLGILAAAGLVLADIVGRIADDINRLNEEKISSFATTLSSLLQLASMSLTDTGVPEYIAAIGKALDELPEDTEKTVAFKTTADSLANLMQIAQTVEAEQVARIETIISAVSNSEGNERIEKASNTLSSILSNVFDSKNTDVSSRNIVIELDGRKLGEYIDKRENDRARRYIQFS
jgi:hypothetical protein